MRRFRDVRGDDGQYDARDVGRELRQQAVRGVQFGRVGQRVDDRDHGVEAAARDVVGVPLAGGSVAVRVGRRVVRGEDETAAYRVTGVVHGEHRRAGRRREPHISARAPARAHRALQLLGQPQRRVHQLLEAQDEDPPRTAQLGGDSVRHGGQGGLQPGPVVMGEAV